MKITLGLGILLLHACVSSSGNKATESLQQPDLFVVPALTTLPEDYSFKDYEGTLQLVGPGMVTVGRVARPFAQVRQGPSVIFPVHDTLLSKNDEIVLFEHKGKWIRFLQPTTAIAGWIHADTIKIVQERKSLQVAFKDLPATFSVQDVQDVYSFPEQKKLHASIPKGSIFKVLKIEKGKKLVWLNQTNTLMWVAEKEFQ